MLHAAIHGLSGRSNPAASGMGVRAATRRPPVLRLPQYRGSDWLRADLPRGCEPWPVEPDETHPGRADAEGTSVPWEWPAEQVYVFGDPHADAEAFLASLVASGGIEKTGRPDHAFRLTDTGRTAWFIVAGDCLDKGPGNLRLLRVLRLLMLRGARVSLLAGNHDIRILLGMRSVNPSRQPCNEHFFVRMGVKVVPFLVEINEQYLTGRNALRDIPGTAECRRRLYPSGGWYEQFPRLAGEIMPAQAVARELKRLQQKIDRFEDDCEAAGLTLRHAYAAALKWQTLFLRPQEEFYWFFRTMQLACRLGSFLFIHAGLDDSVAEAVDSGGVRSINRRFRQLLHGDAFRLYYGPIGNCFRTKYRDVDLPFTGKGAAAARHAGIRVVVHGHRNLLHGQRIVQRHGIMNFECDTTMDCNTRRKEGLRGAGAGVTIVNPGGVVMGISTDHPSIKLYTQGGSIPRMTI